MRDYEYLFATILQQRLKEKIIGKVFVRISNDALYIKVERWEEGVMYEQTVDDIATKIRNGLTIEYIAYEILREYKTSLLKRYLW